MEHQRIYCGNNTENRNLRNGNLIIGTRSMCLRKGIGKGLNLPYDENSSGPYNPIDQRRIYCGDRNILPNGYDYMGNLPLCLQKGIGIGKHRKTLISNRRIIMFIRKILPIILAMLGYIMIYLYLRISKPSVVTDQNNPQRIITRRFVVFYLILILLWTLILIIIWNFWMLKRY